MRRGVSPEDAAEAKPGVARLREEHAVIERVLSAVETLVPRLRTGDDVAAQAVVGALHFFTDFLDRCHVAKEEEVLFPIVAAHGAAAPRRVLTILRAEHARGQRTLQGLRRAAVQDWKQRRAIDQLAAYVLFLRQHVAKEDEVLFSWAARALTAEDQARVADGLAAVEERELGAAGLQALGELAKVVEQTAHAPQTESPGRRGLLVEQVMSQKPRVVGPDDSVAHAAALMEAVGTREVPVVQEGRLVGILTARDMQPHQGHFEWTPVRTAMTREPVTVSPDTEIGAAARILIERCFNSLPVLAGGALVGMVRRVDLLRLLVPSGSRA